MNKQTTAISYDSCPKTRTVSPVQPAVNYIYLNSKHANMCSLCPVFFPGVH